MEKKKRINVRIVKETIPCWYRVGEVHEVGNYVAFGFAGGAPRFEIGDGYKVIRASDCIILPPKKKMTLSQIESKLGHAVEIIEELK
jgi:hypothetical protein